MYVVEWLDNGWALDDDVDITEDDLIQEFFTEKETAWERYKELLIEDDKETCDIDSEEYQEYFKEVCEQCYQELNETNKIEFDGYEGIYWKEG